jgi:hypothetical protein
MQLAGDRASETFKIEDDHVQTLRTNFLALLDGLRNRQAPMLSAAR